MSIIIGIGLLIISGLLFYFRKRNIDKSFLIKSTKTSSTAELNELCESITKEIGAGAFNEYVELKGKIECDNPLIAELSNEECVYYRVEITRKWEETYTEVNSQTGKEELRTRQGSDTLSSNERYVDFYLNDGSGKILVKPSDAEYVTVKSIDQFQTNTNKASINFGSFTLNIPSNVMSGNRRTLGYQFTEHIIPMNSDLYILGSATDSDRQLSIKCPTEKDKRYIISVKSEEELLKQIGTNIKILFVTGIVSAVAGVGFIIYGFAKLI